MPVLVLSSHLMIKSISNNLQDVENFPEPYMQHYNGDKHGKK